MFEEKIFGEAGEKAILEKFQKGYELSFFVLTDGSSYSPLPMAQDHKQLNDGDQGPNTGGMGTVAPISVDKSLYNKIIDQVVEPTVTGFQKDNYLYRGVVFIGLMITEEGPQVLEYNIRFGDPETQVLLPLLDQDWGEIFYDVAEGRVPQLQWKEESVCCVVLAAEDYPQSAVKGSEIQGDLSEGSDSYILHAGTRFENDRWSTNGGRVLNVLATDNQLPVAIKKAYQRVEQIKWKSMQFRKDIGAKQLI